MSSSAIKKSIFLKSTYRWFLLTFMKSSGTYLKWCDYDKVNTKKNAKSCPVHKQQLQDSHFHI